MMTIQSWLQSSPLQRCALSLHQRRRGRTAPCLGCRPGSGRLPALDSELSTRRQQDGPGDVARLQPKHSFEDGTAVYEASALAAVSIEDLLTA